MGGRQDRLAYVTGAPGADVIALEGKRLYPREGGTTTVASELAWSRDGLALAFLERPAAGPPRLVLLADVGNETGDTTWDLPAGKSPDGLRVFWTGPDRLVVGRNAASPVFAATFSIQRPPRP